MVAKHVDVSCAVRMLCCLCGWISMSWCASCTLVDCCMSAVLEGRGFVCCGCNLRASSSNSYHQDFAKENGNRQVLDNNFPLQSTLTSFVV